MIESCYWKEALLATAQSLRPVKNPPRFSERRLCILERDVMVGFFMVRKLIETHKLGPKTKDLKLIVYSCPCTKEDPTWYDNFHFWDAYDIDNERRETKKPLYIANQFVHSVASHPVRGDDRNWQDIFVMSDFDRKNCIWRVPISEIRRLFLVAHEDYPGFRMQYNHNKKDYDVSAT